MRLTHVHTCETYSHYFSITNRTACALVNNFTPNLLLYNYIFFYKLITIVTRHCVAATYYAALSFALYNIILLVSSASPHIKVILPPFLLLRSRYLYPFRTWRLLISNNKTFFLLLSLSCHGRLICISK